MIHPSYLESYHNGNLNQVIEKLFRMLEVCSLCPRKCGVNRLKNRLGFCQSGFRAKIYSFMPHHGEEPPLSGQHGSGTIFFSNCNLHCVYCQNYEFSQKGQGREVEPQDLAGFMIQLQDMKCHNINLVTPTHVLPQILEALSYAIPLGLKIPLCYNTSGYELVDVIRLLEGVVDIYLADIRYADAASARKYSQAADYPKRNQESLKEMYRQVGILKFNQNGIIKRGLIIRHLVMPNKIAGTAKVMQFIAEELSCQTYISLMSQYFPSYEAGQYPEISRRITNEEYQQAQQIMHKYGLTKGWIQDSRGRKRFAGINIKPNL